MKEWYHVIPSSPKSWKQLSMFTSLRIHLEFWVRVSETKPDPWTVIVHFLLGEGSPFSSHIFRYMSMWPRGPPPIPFHKDRVVLWTCRNLIPKMLSKFHLNQAIHLPNACPNPKDLKKKFWHSLYVYSAHRVHLAGTSSCRKVDFLFARF